MKLSRAWGGTRKVAQREGTLYLCNFYTPNTHTHTHTLHLSAPSCTTLPHVKSKRKKEWGGGWRRLFFQALLRCAVEICESMWCPLQRNDLYASSPHRQCDTKSYQPLFSPRGAYDPIPGCAVHVGDADYEHCDGIFLGGRGVGVTIYALIFQWRQQCLFPGNRCNNMLRTFSRWKKKRLQFYAVEIKFTSCLGVWSSANLNPTM